MPDLEACTRCDSPLEEGADVDGAHDALLCRDCAPGGGGKAHLDGAALRLLRESLRRPLPDIASAGVPPATVSGASRALRSLVLHYVGKEIKSLRFLESLEKMPQ
jgi:recombinational DNA repair protein (RecF pathway)